MFEDSTFESACTIHTRSRQWMLAAFACNASILLAFIMVPLIFPPMLPHQFCASLMEIFVPPKPQLPQQPTQTARPAIEAQNDPFQAPRTIPSIIVIPAVPDPPVIPASSSLTDPGNDLFRKPADVPVIRPAAQAPLRVSSGTVEGLLIQKKAPVYPAFALATRISGTVTLGAIISKSGVIENLRVISGPAVLRQAALDAVRTWRYRPYLLDGHPVEVETTVTVIFTLQR